MLFHKQFSHKHLARHVSQGKIYGLPVIGFAGLLWLNQDLCGVVFTPIAELGTGRTLGRRHWLWVFNGLLQLREEIVSMKNSYGNKSEKPKRSRGH